MDGGRLKLRRWRRCIGLFSPHDPSLIFLVALLPSECARSLATGIAPVILHLQEKILSVRIDNEIFRLKNFVLTKRILFWQNPTGSSDG